ncbi:hypothetical protein CKQ90_33150, partial [Klebsiella pneumoniae]
MSAMAPVAEARETLLNDKGYQEVITYSFVDPKVTQLIHAGEEALILPSPISSEMSAMAPVA